MEQNKKKKQPKKLISLLLVFALLITGLFAFLTATDSKTNVFTIGNVAIDLIEDFDVDQDGQLESNEHYVDEQPPTVQNILPGQTILKQPYIENTGDNEAWVYAVVKVPTAPASALTGNNGSVTAGTAATPLEIVVTGYAIQDHYGDNDAHTMNDVWTAYAPDLDGDATANSSPNPQVFSLNNINANWTLLNAPGYYSTDGFNYYVYGYNTKLAVGASTPSVFTSVTLASDIGGQSPVGVAYYVPNETPGSSGTGEGNADLGILIPEAPEGYHLIHFEPVMPGQSIGDLYWDSSLSRLGSTSEWTSIEDDTPAYSGMIVEESMGLKLNYRPASVSNVIPPEYYIYDSTGNGLSFVGVHVSYWDNVNTTNAPCSIIIPERIQLSQEEKDAATQVSIWRGAYQQESTYDKTTKGYFAANLLTRLTSGQDVINAAIALYPLGTYNDTVISTTEGVTPQGRTGSWTQATLRSVNITGLVIGGSIQSLSLTNTANRYRQDGASSFSVGDSADILIEKLITTTGLKTLSLLNKFVALEQLDIASTVTLFLGMTGCSAIENVVIPANVQYLGNITTCANLKTLDIKNKNIMSTNSTSVSSATPYCPLFTGNTSCETIYLPLIDHFTNYSFYNNAALKDIYYPGTAAEWNALNPPTNLTTYSALKVHCSDEVVKWDTNAGEYIPIA